MISNQVIEPNRNDILNAVLRTKGYINNTPVLTSETLNKITGSKVYFKCENFQKVGAFKSRGAVNALFSLNPEQIKNGVGTHSSGNHAQALSRAATLRNTKAYIVMPENAPLVKIDAVRAYGGLIHFCKPTLEAREATLAELKAKFGLTEIHPYNNFDIIAGQATAAYELIQKINDLNIILCPVGGGGLLSGTALAAKYFGKDIKIIAGEPEGANDAMLSFKAAKLLPSVNPKTIADGLLTSLGSITFPIIQKYVSDIICVDDEAIIKAMKFVWERMKIIIEPSSAVPLALLLENKINVRDLKVGIIVSGGNVDLKKLPW